MSKNLGMCHIIVPAHVQLEKVLPGYFYESYRAKKICNMEKELQIVYLEDKTIRLDVYVKRSLYERLKQCGLFAIYEHKIRDVNHMANVLYSLMMENVSLATTVKRNESCTHELNIEYNDWKNVPKEWNYLSDDSSSDCY